MQSSEAGAAGCSVLLHRTAAASSSRQKGAEQQQRKAQQQPGCFALLCLAAHCTAPTTAATLTCQANAAKFANSYVEEMVGELGS